MKAKFGAIVTDGRGKVGGHVFSRNRSGAYMRTKVTPSNPQTVAQMAARSLLATFSQGWRALTQAQRNAWDAAVSQWARTNVFGDLVNPTGKNLYTRLNINIANVGGTAIVSPPEPGSVPAGIIANFVFNATAGTALVNVPDAVETLYYTMRATVGLSPGISFVKNRLRIIEFQLGTSVAPWDIYDSYNAKFGIPAVGQKVYISVIATNILTGQTSTASEKFSLVL